MNTRQVIELAKKYGLGNITISTVQRWRLGYYKKGDNQVWYFPDHSRLPYNDMGNGRPLEYSEPAVHAWLKMLAYAKGKL